MAAVELVEKPVEANLAEQVDAIACQIYQFADRVEHIADTIFELIGNVDPTGNEDSGQVGDLKKAMTLAEMLTEVGKGAGPVGEQLEGLAQKMQGCPNKGSSPLVYGDEAIIEAWETRRSALLRLRNLPEQTRPSSATEDPEAQEGPIWEEINAAEGLIRSQVATTSWGIIIQLLTGLGSSVSDMEGAAAVNRGDVSWLTENQEEMNWIEQLVVSAIRSLQATNRPIPSKPEAAVGTGKSEDQSRWDALLAAYLETESTAATEDDHKVAQGLLGRLMDMPSPGRAALRWKLDYLFEIEDNYTPSFRSNFVRQTIADYRRMLPGGQPNKGGRA